MASRIAEADEKLEQDQAARREAKRVSKIPPGEMTANRVATAITNAINDIYRVNSSAVQSSALTTDKEVLLGREILVETVDRDGNRKAFRVTVDEWDF